MQLLLIVSTFVIVVNANYNQPSSESVDCSSSTVSSEDESSYSQTSSQSASSSKSASLSEEYSSSSSSSSSAQSSSSARSSSKKEYQKSECSRNERYVKKKKICQRTCSCEDSVCETITGCVCVDGYVRNDQEECVQLEDCPESGQCPENEKYSECKITCASQTCASIYTSFTCPEKPTCEPGCDCIDGYLRNGTVTDPCIPSDQCPPPIPFCEEGQVYNECGTACELTCENINNPPEYCTEECVAKCFCKEGLVRAKNDSCVTPEQCPPPSQQCPENEKYSECKITCASQTCASIYTSFTCPEKPTCESGCDCIAGYLRNGTVTDPCITSDQCPPPIPFCEEGQVYNECGTACELTCENINNPPEYCTEECVAKCFCKEGLVRAKNDSCVTPEQCPPPSQQCPENEKYSECKITCASQTCDNRNKKFNCPIQNSENCEPGCDCIDGYFRNGTLNEPCIPGDKCPPASNTCGENETPANGCYNPCFDKSCKDRLNTQAKFCPLYCQLNGCFCSEGFFRNDDNKCVPACECPKPECRPEEVYNNCGTACELTCSNYENPPNVCTAQCVEKCFCAKGLVRASNGDCIVPNKCPKPVNNCDENETPAPTGCYNSCNDRLCDDRGSSNQRVCPQYCFDESGCYCSDGYYRSPNSTCVPAKDCPPLKCKKGEVYNRCGSACNILTCDNYQNPPDACTADCIDDCFCEKGLVRASNGDCIKPEQCEQCGENEEPTDCYNSCLEKTCENRFTSENKPCPKNCSQGCKCIDGYYKNDQNICVPAIECPPPQCPENQVYNNCGSACELTCANYQNPPQVCTLQCVEKCFCEKGLVRAKDGSCVKPDQCPATCGVNEEPSDCVNDCDPTCKTRFRSDKVCSQQCKKGCKCIEGYLRNDDGYCVPIDKCSPALCNDDEERNNCGTACEANCENYNPNGIPCTRQCVDGCFCKKGLIRASKNSLKCIKPEECEISPPEECGPNEEFSKCKIHCPPQLCSTLEAPIFCFAPDYCTEPGCNCKKGYLRNGTTTDPCIAIDECPKRPKCGLNEHFEDCPGNCPPQTCRSRLELYDCDKVDKSCRPQCRCDDGYLRNSDGKCVINCDAQCGVNEEPTDCYNSCLEITCANRFSSGDKVCPQYCEQGCKCIDGYYKNDKNVCVPVNECPPPECPNNQVFNECGTACELTCSNYKNPPKACTKQCVPKCFCKKGLVRADDGSCVKPEQCSICGKNEEFADCKQECPPQTCQALYTKFRCQSDIPCNPGCNCKDGYRRNGTTTDPCIPTNDCPNIYTPNQCGENEVYNECRRKCPPQTCASKYTLYSCIQNISCEAGCDCVKGYLRNGTINDPCIPSDLCPKLQPACNDNEHFEDCPPNCPPQTCLSRLERYDCSKFNKTCQPQCRCNDGYLRNKCGVCVADCDAKPPQVCGKNEVFNECKKDCPPNTCKALDAQFKCRGDQPIKAECDCETGYRRNGTTTDPCIPEEECPNYKPPTPVCGLNEEYTDCANTCETTCRTRFRPDKQCRSVCQEGCKCVEGFLKHDNGTCVPTYECSPPQCNEDEYFPKCGPSCEDTCSNYNNTCRICTLRCATGCFCKEGLIRADDGITCVKKEECPAPTCNGKNEHYEVCPDTCQLNTCKGRSTKIDCTKQRKCCRPQCWCDEGFLRNDEGICIPDCDC